MKEIEGDANKSKEICDHGLEELTLLKCLWHPDQSTNSVQSLSKFQWDIFHRRKVLKFLWNKSP